VEALNTGAGRCGILRRYLLRNVITSVPVLLTLNAADAVLVLAAWASWAWAPRIDSGMGRRPAAGSHRAAHRGIWWTAPIPAWRCCVGTGLFVPGRGLEPWVSGGDGGKGG